VTEQDKENVDQYMDSIPAHTFAKHTLFEEDNSSECMVRLYYENKVIPEPKYRYLDAIVTMLMNYQDFIDKHDGGLESEDVFDIVLTRYDLLRAISNSQKIVRQ